MSKRILGLRTCIYVVSNLQEAKKWYAKVFETEPYFDEPFYIGFNVEGYELGLMPSDEMNEGSSNGVLTYWGVNDVQIEYDRMISLGATEHEKPSNVGGPIVVASCFDPWGNTIGLIYNPTFKLP